MYNMTISGLPVKPPDRYPKAYNEPSNIEVPEIDDLKHPQTPGTPYPLSITATMTFIQIASVSALCSLVWLCSHFEFSFR